MQLSPRQEKIVEIVKDAGPVTGEQIAQMLNVTRAALRSDLAILSMAGFLEARPRVGYSFRGGHPDQATLVEQLQQYLVKHIKSLPVVVRPNTSIYDAAIAMFLQDVGTLFVADADGVLVGAVSRKDLLKASLGGSEVHQMPVSVIMTRMPNIVMTTPEESAWAAAKKIVDHEVDSLPVVKQVQGQDGRQRYQVIGRLTKTNITRLFVELGEGGVRD